MPSYMCVLCKISSKFVKRRNLSVSFHGFPCDPVRKQAWEEFCGIQSGVVCSDHFADNCFLSGRDEPDKRRRLVKKAVPSIRYPVSQHGTHILPTNSSEEINSSYYNDNSVSIEEMDMSEENIISQQHDIISQLQSQIHGYQTQLEDATKKLNEMEIAIFERDCIIDELQKELDEVTQKLNSGTLQWVLPDQIKTEIKD